MSDSVSLALLGHAGTLLKGAGAVAPSASLDALAIAGGFTSAGLTRADAWSPQPDVLHRLRASASAITLPRTPAGCTIAALAAAPDGSAWVLWGESARADWPDDDLAAFAVVALATGRLIDADPALAELAARQSRLEVAANLTRTLSHDFGNILTGIMGFTELAQAQPMPASTPLHSYLMEIYRAAQTGAQFIDRLRLFSRRHNGMARPSPVSLALAGLAPRLQAARDAGHHVHIDVPDGLPPVGVGPDGLHHVLGALIENAREALSQPGAVSVSARAVTLDGAGCREVYGSAVPGAFIEVTVADTGAGLPPEVSRRLFDEPFFSTKSRRKGFGLAVAYGILSSHGGGLRLYPGGERGVVARVVLPVSTAPVRAELPPAPLIRTAGGERVLVVDDEPEVLASVSASLEQAGYRVHRCGGGEAALEAYFAAGPEPFSLVLTDVIMPGLGGVELVRRLLKRDPSARVLYMSGFVSGDFMRHDFAGRHFDLVNKPFRLEELLSAVRTALARPVPTRRTPREAPLVSAKK